MALYPTYLKDFNKFLERSTSHSNAVNLLENKGAIKNLKNTKHYISIGSSDGRFDRQIISRCMPCLEQYEAVDIDSEALNNLNEMYSTSKYMILTHCSPGEDWSGPDRTADVISLIHVMYYVTDVHGFLTKCLSWLSPGGCIIIILAEEDGLRTDLQEVEDLFRDNIRKVRDWIKFRNEGIKEYSEYRIEGTHNMTGVEQSTANFIEQRQLTEGEVEDVIENVSVRYGDITCLPSSDLMWMIRKTTLSSE